MDHQLVAKQRTAIFGAQGQRILRLYHLYRLLIGFALVLLISSDLEGHLLELTHMQLFHYSCWTYLIVNVITIASMHHVERITPLFALALFDIVQLSVLFYAAGGTPSGIGNLIIVAVAIANILLRGRVGFLIAAVAAAGIIYLTFYLSISNTAASNQFMQAGILGALCFAAALFVQRVSKRLRVSENLAKQRASDVANLEELNAVVIQRMRTGILVLDASHRVLQANQSALTMIGYEKLQGRILDPHFPALINNFKQWRSNPDLRTAPIQSAVNSAQLQASFVQLQNEHTSQTLIFLEDTSQLNQHAQQLKLVSLGRLTAGIAHEIRNPLGAISHAAQLLHESSHLDAADQRLTQIIQDQSRRMNTVIENVLQLSRQRQAEPQLLDLKYWLHRFSSEFRRNSNPNRMLHLTTKGSGLQTRMDSHQLDQVLSNLVENGMRYSSKSHAQSQVWLHLYRHPQTDLPTLEIHDDGAGVPIDDQQSIFEPFFTTENKGTGLGLYISRELCASNQARLDYAPRDNGGSCFKITFAHPHKMSV
ncbi:MAG: ATP-binding protein [Pseudomonas sp.]|nr:ATP-binding protein [Pseudomonas sp.]